MDGPVILQDIGITITRGQLRDLDLIGRENAERSNDVKLALAKNYVKTVRKDAISTGSGVPQQVVDAISTAASKMDEATAANTDVVKRLEERNRELEKKLAEQKAAFDAQIEEQRRHNEQAESNANKVLDEVRDFAKRLPIEIRTIGEAMRNIQVERAQVAEARSSLAESGHTEEEIKAQERILALKDKKLEKNFKDLGKTVSSSATDVTEALDALDELGI
jgi:chromosome segregation ATPase